MVDPENVSFWLLLLQAVVEALVLLVDTIVPLFDLNN